MNFGLFSPGGTFIPALLWCALSFIAKRRRSDFNYAYSKTIEFQNFNNS